MNHIFRTVWNEHLQTWVAASETTRTARKKSCRLAAVLGLLCGSGLLASGSAWAQYGNAWASYSLPDGQTVTSPVGTYIAAAVYAGNPGFNIGDVTLTVRNATIDLAQTGVATAQRVATGTPDAIMRTELSNSTIYLRNPNQTDWGPIGVLSESYADNTKHQIDIAASRVYVVSPATWNNGAVGVLATSWRNANLPGDVTIGLHGTGNVVDVINNGNGRTVGIEAGGSGPNAAHPANTFAVSEEQAGSIRVTSTNAANAGSTNGIYAKMSTPFSFVNISLKSDLSVDSQGSGDTTGIDVTSREKTDIVVNGKISVNAANAAASAFGIRVDSQKDSAVAIAAAGSLQSSGKGLLLSSANAAAITVDGKIDATQNAIEVTQAKTLTLTGSGAIRSTAGNAIDLSGMSDATATADLNLHGDVQATTAGQYALLGGAARTNVIANAGQLTGNVKLGGNDDTLTLKNDVVFTGVPQFDGGAGQDTLNFDALANPAHIYTAATDDLAKGNNMVNWETINLRGSRANLNGDLFAAGTPGALNLQDGAATLAIAATNPNLYGNVTNAGTISWINLGNTLNVVGNYQGIAGSKLVMETKLGDDASPTDKMAVTGNVTGTSALDIRNAGGTVAQTVRGIQVIQVGGASAAGAFTLAHAVEAGAYQYLLRQGDALGGDTPSWYLTSQLLPVNPPVNPPAPVAYRPAVANYIGGQAVMAFQGMAQLDTLHQRMGEQRVMDEEGRLTWLRPSFTRQEADGKTRFGYRADLTGLQLGREVYLSRDDAGTAQRGAVTFDYASVRADFNDRLRPQGGLSAHTGQLDGQSLAVGGTYTRMAQDGGYLDLVGQLSSLRSRFSDVNQHHGVQDGWRLGLSVEGGKPVAQWGDWRLEPQGQLLYLSTWNQKFNDGVSDIGAYRSEQLRGRLGLRLFRDRQSEGEHGQFYGIVNVLHDVLPQRSVPIGGTKVKERFARTWGEVGLGGLRQIRKNGHLYADLRYRQALEAGAPQVASGFTLNAGLKIAF